MYKIVQIRFLKPGIHPILRNAFEEQDYKAAIISEQPHLVEFPAVGKLLSVDISWRN